MFGSPKKLGKCKEKKIERKNRRKEKMKEKKNFKSINYFYMFLQTHFTYFSPLYKD